jgi:biotin synthase
VTDARSLIHAAGDALLSERRQLSSEQLAALAALPDESIPALASLAHEVRLAWCGPEVEVEGILSAKTGGCPEDCHFCSQSARFDTVVQATPFLDREELIAAARETAAIGASEFCMSGINALIVGNYLTTLGRSPAGDLQMLADLRMPIGVLSKAI